MKTSTESKSTSPAGGTQPGKKKITKSEISARPEERAMKKQEYIVGIKGVNFTREHKVIATGKRAARWIYVNLYAPPCTKYSQTRAFIVRELQAAQ